MTDQIAPPQATPSLSWWRLNRWYLMALLPLLILAVAVPYWQGVARLGRLDAHQPIEFAIDRPAHFAGARWTVLDRRILKPPGGVNPFHSDANVLSVLFEMQVDEHGNSEDYIGATTYVSDPAGRRWQASSLAIVLPGEEQMATGFTTRPLNLGIPELEHLERPHIEPGKPYRFRQFYLVPQSLPAEELHPEVVISRASKLADARFLRFGD